MESSSSNEILSEFDIECKFKKADLMVLKNSDGGFLSDKCYYDINILGLQYCIEIYPNGYGEGEHRGVAWIFLHIISSPISMQWKIKEKDLLAKIGENNRFIRSKRIKVATFNDVKYYLSFCPNKIENGQPPKTTVCLNIELIKEKKIEAAFDFSIDSANRNYNSQCVFEKSIGYGPWCCSTDDLFDPKKRYIVDGFLTINFQGVLSIEKNEPTVLNCKNGVASKIAQKKNDKDFIIVVGDKEINVHKQVLMNASAVWTGMFESGMKESIENKMFIEDFPFKIVDAAINIFYSNNVPRKFSFEDILSLYKFADKYEIHLIMDLVGAYLIKHLSPTNVCQLIHFSKDFSIKKLHQSCIDFLLKCSKESTPILGLESLDKDFLASMFLNTFRAVDCSSHNC
uniref:BTB domain-containing protein n=1 Tax=Panagrolaimus sp. ES5 TaxID=591445 RepID=A0AC34FA48_9BILA